jgi:shikimate dehydrogenase
VTDPIWPTGATRIAGVIGDPVRHSLSPTLHNAAFRALDLDWAYVAFDVAAGDAANAVAGMRALHIEGLNVTMPHKADVIPALDALSPTAERLGAVNTIAWRGTELYGDNTDGVGFLDSLRLDHGLDVSGWRCVILGAGGAARAVVAALADAGVKEVVVVNRTPEKATVAAQLAGSVGRVGAVEEAKNADLIVNATPLGMGVWEGEIPVGQEHLSSGQVVCDLVYHPHKTALLEAAKEAGAVAVNGLGMLIHQAAHAFRLWTGEDPPLAAMSAAAMRELAHRE